MDLLVLSLVILQLYVLLFLEQHPGVTDVRMMDQKPADPSAIDTWEQVRIP